MYKILFFTSFFILTIFMIGCGGGSGNKPNVNGSNASVPAVNTNNDNGGITTTKKDVGPTTNDAPTLKPVVLAYYEALQKKDDAMMRGVLSKEMIAGLERDMKEEKKTGLAAYIAETETIPQGQIEIRNEKIEGNKATAELKGGTYVNWSSVAFVNEDGKWKRTNGGGEMEAVKPVDPVSNTRK